MLIFLRAIAKAWDAYRVFSIFKLRMMRYPELRKLYKESRDNENPVWGNQ